MNLIGTVKIFADNKSHTFKFVTDDEKLKFKSDEMLYLASRTIEERKEIKNAIIHVSSSEDDEISLYVKICDNKWTEEDQKEYDNLMAECEWKK